MNDLTEKLKELLNGIRIVNDRYFSSGDAAAIAKQLAPEIEKMMPRWIPVMRALESIYEANLCMCHEDDCFCGHAVLQNKRHKIEKLTQDAMDLMKGPTG